jgi:hypothetical protein
MLHFLQVGMDKAIQEVVKRSIALTGKFRWPEDGVFHASPARIVEILYEKGAVDQVWERGTRYLADPALSRQDRFRVATYVRAAAYQRGNKQDLERIREQLKTVAGEEYDGKLGRILIERPDFEDGRPDKVLALLNDLRDRGVALNSENRFDEALDVHRACLGIATSYANITGFPRKSELQRQIRIASHNVGDTAINDVRHIASEGGELRTGDMLKLLGAERLLDQSLEIQKLEGREWGLTYQSYLQSVVLRRDFVTAADLLERVIRASNPLASDLLRLLDAHPEEVSGLEGDAECAVKLETLRAVANGNVVRSRTRGLGPKFVVASTALLVFLCMAGQVLADNMKYVQFALDNMK